MDIGSDVKWKIYTELSNTINSCTKSSAKINLVKFDYLV